MKVLVTGATGFIGKNLVEKLLDENYSVLCVTRKKIPDNMFSKKVENAVIDLQDIEELGGYMDGVDIIIHMAAQLGHYGIPYDYYFNVNYLGTVKLAKLAVKHNIKQFILCSAPFVVGLGGRNTKEDEPYAPSNEYSETKMLAELGTINICESRVPYTILRPSFVYGIGDERRIKLYKYIKKRCFALTTNGKAYIQPTYVSDIVDGFIISILNERAYNQIFNLGAENDCTSKEYLDCIAKHVGSKLIHINIGYTMSVLFANVIDFICRKVFKKSGFVNKGRIDFFAKDHSCNIDKAKELLGYDPKISLDKGIKMTIDWARKNKYL